MTKLKPKTSDVARLAYSVAEGGRMLGLSGATMHRAISHKLIHAPKVGRVRRIPAAEIERVAREGLPPIPRYVRTTTGPTKRGRPLRSDSRPAAS